jgi:hypothetical protein
MLNPQNTRHYRQVLGYLFFQHLLDDGLDPFPDAPADLLLGQPLELLSVHSALHA